MKNGNLIFIDLEICEILYLQALVTTKQDCKLDVFFHFGTYCEQSICINKNNNMWEVYIVERGQTFDKAQFDDCLDACICAIKHSCDSKQQYIKVTQYFKNTIKNKLVGIQPLSEEELKNKISECISKIKK